MACLGDQLPERWWRKADALRNELDAHGTLAAAARAHGVRPNTVTQGWHAAVGDPLLRGPLASRVNLASEPSELDRLAQRNRELELELSRLYKTSIFEGRMLVALRELLPTATPRYSPRAIPKGKPGEHEMALLWSDVHAGERVSLEETNGLNEYDWPIMLKRLDGVLRGILAFKEARPYEVRKLHIWALGDMVSGEIHDELRATNEFPVIESAVQLGIDAAAWLERFIPEFESIHFVGVAGNHGRLYRKPESKQRYSNFDWLVYHTMQRCLSAYPSITWEIPKATRWPVELCGRRVLLWHGDGVRSTMVDVPWGGIIRYVGKLRNEYAALGKPIDYFACGHWHEADIVKNRRIIINGSVIGPNEYSLDKLGGGEPAAQVLLTYHPKHGLTDASFIDL